MKLCPAIIAALPREVEALVKGWERRKLRGGVVVYTNGNEVVACAGMGAARAKLAVQAAMDSMPITDLLSVGFAGACDPTLEVGEIIRAGVVVDASTGEQFFTSQFRQILVSVDTISSVSEKARLHAEYSAHAVDMEAASVARLAQKQGLSFHAIKVISDASNFEVVDFSKFSTEDGQFREGAFALHAALRPAMWGKVIALGRNSSKALRSLTEALDCELDWYRKRA